MWMQHLLGVLEALCQINDVMGICMCVRVVNHTIDFLNQGWWGGFLPVPIIVFVEDKVSKLG